MILVDTSIWIDAIQGRGEIPILIEMMQDKRVLLHPWVFGELLVGNLGQKREKILNELQIFPKAPIYSLEELQSFIDAEKLFGKGLSLIDAQLIYTALVNDCMLWTRDKSLLLLAKRYKKVYDPRLSIRIDG